jgi:UDP-N-acetylglucosamine 2-epimerase (non-hydrolysing)/GDP/UDP-N,N'-diacetylbacillosamine 2-epimerase (hydrolysing)
MKKRKICVVTGTRAEYGVLYPVMKAIQRNSKLELSLIVTGMHLMREFGSTAKEIESDGFRIDAKVPMLSREDTLQAMAKSLGKGIIRMTDTLDDLKPDILMVIADRGEALAAAIAGAHMKIPVAHVHGGDVTTGACIDEPIRHAITRFAHIHFPATKKSAERIVKMGEEPWRVHVVGPLGVYAMAKKDFIPKDKLCKKLGLSPNRPILLVLQHPVTTEVEKAGEQMRETMDALVELGEQTVIIYPNADAGGREMIKVIRQYENYQFFKIFKNFPYRTFLSLMKISTVMVGNSSSAIIEAPLFGVPAVNIGKRQEGRERGSNVIDVPHEKKAIVKAVKNALEDSEFRRRISKSQNPFNIVRKGGIKIANILSKVKIDNKLLQKTLTY